MISAAEFRLALRLVWKQPLLAVTTVLALGMGICIATAGFTFMNGLTRGRLAFDRGDAFVRLTAYRERDGSRTAIADERLSSIREGAASFEYLGVIAGASLNVVHPTGQVESVVAARVTPGWFRYAPYRRVAGRTLTGDDGRVGAPPVAVIGERLWRKRYDGATSALGRMIDVAGTDRRIVGVAPDGAAFPNSPDIWIPLPESRPLDPAVGGVRAGTVAGVLARGTPLAAATEDVNRITALRNTAASLELPVRVQVMAFTDLSELGIGTALQIGLTALVLVMLLIATNVGNLMFARATARQDELAVRAAPHARGW